MPGQKPVLTGLAAALLPLVLAYLAAPASGEEVRILFAGDVLLSRQVEVEISRTASFPWEGLSAELAKADLVLANLEGSVGEESGCLPGPGPCFAVDPRRIALLARAGFSALSVENNHAGDLGEAGRIGTRRALREAGVRPVGFEEGPSFFRAGEATVAVVAISLVPGRDGRVQRIPSPEVRRQLRLASRLASLVVVSVHWGEELLEWPSEGQRVAARWLVENGAGVVVGHHPHVVQPAECVEGKPVFYSVGNHLFDQKYPATKEGLIADCRIAEGGVACTALATRRASGSFSPVLTGGGAEVAASLAGCRVPLNRPLRLGDTMLRPAPFADGSAMVLEAVREGRTAIRTRPTWLVSAEAALLQGRGKPPLLLTLERHPSPIDGEDGVRPYVYEAGPHGLVARWRGSALAWPLVDAKVLPGTDLLCALHRGDAFLTLDASSPPSRAAVYRWNGFGFSGVEEPAALAACRAAWGL